MAGARAETSALIRCQYAAFTHRAKTAEEMRIAHPSKPSGRKVIE